MNNRLLNISILSIVVALAAGCSPRNDASEVSSTEPTLKLVKQWVIGNYNNLEQAEADMSSNLPPEQMHRPMHQLFVPVEAPNIDGYIVYQQSSVDGSENPAMIFRHGLIQYLPDENSTALLQRELYFKDTEMYKNLHHNPQILLEVTLNDMTWDEGCDFYLTTSKDGLMVSGPLITGACVMFNTGLQKNMYADDLVEITTDEYRFRGRYIDDDGNILWGTESDILNTLVRQ
jgi:hypothetical protein